MTGQIGLQVRFIHVNVHGFTCVIPGMIAQVILF